MAIFTVSDSAGLYDALANATGGDTIKLAAGDYGSLDLGLLSSDDFAFDTPVTITSDDPLSRASFSEMNLKGVENLTFDNVVFDYTYDSDDAVWFSPFQVQDSSGITIKNSLFDGDVASGKSEADDGYGTGKGLFVIGSTGVSIENNEFANWHRGLVVTQSEDIDVSGNDVHSMRSDGMNFANVQSVRIEDNYLHDFKGSRDSDDHMDMIQFWTNGTDAPSTDIVIRGNTLDIGDGDWTQSIFMRNDMVDRGLAGPEMFYQNILIEENIIINGHSHGITVGETDGLTIRNNTLLSVDASDDRLFQAPAIYLSGDSTSVTVEHNAVSAINGYDNQAGWSLNNNAFIQNTELNSPGYYADLFFESSSEGRDSAWSYIAAPGSMIENLSAGASRLVLDVTPDTVTPHFNVTSSINTSQTLVFDATHTYGPAGQILPDGATFIWDFGDGKTATGRVVEHGYDTAANYNVTLTVVLDGQNASQAATAYAEVGIPGDDVLAFNASDGSFYLQDYGTTAILTDSDTASVGTADGQAVDLGGAGTRLEIPKEAFSRFFGSDAFEMSMTLQADQPGTSWGEVARIHSSIVVSVQGDGDLNVRLFSDSGEYVDLTTQGVSVNDGAAHDISIVFDDASNSLQILIDGQVAASGTVPGSMPEMGSWGLVFGEPWGGQNFDGKLSAFELRAASTDYPAFEGVLEGPDGPAPEPIRDPPRGEEPIPEPKPGSGTDEGALPGVNDALTDYVTNFETLKASQLRDDAYVEATADGSVLHLDGEADFVRLGKLAQFEDSEQLSFSVVYSKDIESSDTQRLAWKSKEFGLAVEGDSLKVFVGQADNPFYKAIRIDNLGLDDTETHQVTVMVDAATDRLQVVLDGVLVLDKQQGIDIEFSDEFARAWKVGGGRKDSLDGEIYDLRVDASADFLPESVLVPDDPSLVA